MSLDKTCARCAAPLTDDAPEGAVCADCLGAIESEQTMATPPSGTAGVSYRLPASAPRAEVLGDFEILDKLGQGGMGAVYRARQIPLDRVVALKVLPEYFAADEENVARFQREARIAAGLVHANIVHVFSSGIVEGTHFIAMELVEGENLRQRMKRERLSIPEALHICAEIARGLQYGWESAHLVHRDIKPGNIFLSADGAVKVGDLGLAKSMSGVTSGLTQTGTSLGTALYMSPEQVRGDKTFDFRSDVYSLGCTLYEMLTGHPPYSAADGMTVMNMHLNAPMPAILKAMPGCPIPLARLVGKMLKKNARERHASYSDLVAEIEMVREQIESGVTTTTGPSKVVEAWKQVGDLEAAPGASYGMLWAGLALLLVVGGGVAWWAMQPKKPKSASATPTKASAPPSSRRDVSTTANGTSGHEAWQNMLRDPAKLVTAGNAKIIGSSLQFTGAGAVRPDSTPFRDGAVRIRTVFDPKKKNLQVRIRKVADGQACYQALVSDGKTGILQRVDKGSDGTWSSTTLRTLPLPTPLQAGQEYELELRAVGQTITVSWNGQVLISIIDHEIAEGGIVIASLDSVPVVVKSAEILNLDGVPEAAALKLAGQASATNAASSPWRDGLAEAPLKEVIAKADHTDKGYLLPSDSRFSFPGHAVQSGAVRVRTTWEAGTVLQLHLIQVNGSGFYRAGLDPQKKRGRLVFVGRGGVERELATSEAVGIAVGQPYDFMFARVGQRLWVMFNGQVIMQAVEPDVSPGTWWVICPGSPIVESKVRVEKIEYVELDGVPEADALKLASAAPSSPATSSDWHDLLADVDLSHAAVRGTWKKTAEGVELAKPGGPGVIEFNEVAPADYEYEIEFTPTTSGNNVNQHLSMDGHTFIWKMNAHSRTPPLYGLGMVDGKSCADPGGIGSTHDLALEPGKRYTSNVKIHPGQLQAFFNGTEYLTWAGDAQRLSTHELDAPLRDPRHLGLGSWGRGVIFHRAVVRTLPALGAAAPAPRADATTLTFGGHRYQLVADQVSWTDAKAKAEQMGGCLVVITSKEENDWIRRTFVDPLEEGKMFWIGATNSGPDGKWRWVNGDAFTFTGWAADIIAGQRFKEANSCSGFCRNVTQGIGWSLWSPVVKTGRNMGFLVEWDD